MDIALPIGIKTVFAEATVGEDGTLHLKDTSQLSLKPGEKVALMISPIAEANGENPKPLQGTVLRYDDPFGPATELAENTSLK